MACAACNPAVAENIHTWSMGRTDHKKTERVPQSVIDALLDKVSVLDLIKESIPVTSSGSAHAAHCPFHTRSDNHPTLSIDNDEQRFACSECKFHGSAIGWLMYHDGLSFQDTVYMLAQRTDTDVSPWITPQSIEASLNKKRALLVDIEHFYAEQLPLSGEALAYVEGRGLSDEIIKRFNIGFAPNERQTLESAFANKERALWNEGLLVRHADGTFGHRFRDRLMFPIRDTEGYTVGFGGRALGDAQPKYLNSPASPTFSKSDLLYGLHESLESSFGATGFILVEGYIDVLALHQVGFSGAVATLGTSASRSHLDTLFSINDCLTVCFDGDAAGIKAAERLLFTALPLLQDHHVLNFVLLPEGLDPDSFVKEHGKDTFQDRLNSPITLESFFHDTLSRSIDLNTIGGKSQLAAHARPYVESVVSNRLRESLVATIEHTIGIPWFELDQG